MAMSSRALLAMLIDQGWQVRRVRGSHWILRHPDHRDPLVVPHPRKDLGTGLVQKILKQARLREIVQ